MSKSTQELPGFELIRPISSNNLTETWIAIDNKTTESVLLKILKPTPDISHELAKEILESSYALQRQINCSQILSAKRLVKLNHRLVIVYPLMDTDIWSPLDLTTTQSDWITYLSKIAIIVDFLHSIGQVHRDLKIDNFLTSGSSSLPRVKLIDLDFLANTGVPASGLILGTPEYIAPEIKQNQPYLEQSDNYSLACSIRSCVHVHNSKLADFVDNIINEDQWSRPRSLITALREADLISNMKYQELLRSLLSLLYIRLCRINSLHRRKKPGDFVKKLFSEINLLGLSKELIEQVALSFKFNRRNTIFAVKEYITTANLSRFGDYWHCDSSSKALFTIYKRLGKSTSDNLFNDDFRPKNDANVQSHLAQLEKLHSEHRFEIEFLTAQEIYQNWKQTNYKISQKYFYRLLQLLGESALNTDRKDEALSAFSETFNYESIVSLESLVLHKKTLILQLECRKTNSFEDKVKTALELALQLKNAKYELIYLRLMAWYKLLDSQYIEADRILDDIHEKGITGNYHDIIVLTDYTRAIILWRKGEHTKAYEKLRGCYKLIDKYNLEKERKPVLASLSMLCFETALCSKSVKYARDLIRISTEPEDYARLPSIFVTLTNSLIRLCEFSKAEYWLRKYNQQIKYSFNPQQLLLYYLSKGFYEMNSSTLSKAEQTFNQALSINNSRKMVKNDGKVYQNIALLAYYRGDYTLSNRHADKAKNIAVETQDATTHTEIEYIEKLVHFQKSGFKDSHVLLPLLGRLITAGSLYYAVECIFYIVLHCDGVISKVVIRETTSCMHLLESSEIPLFRAVIILFECFTSNKERSKSIPTALKRVYVEVTKTRNQMYQFLVSRSLAYYYLKKHKHRLAQQYFEICVRHAKNMGNLSLVCEITGLIPSTEKTTHTEQRYYQMLDGIADVLSNVSDHNIAFMKLLEFAISETGAERGVLFLKSSSSGKLRIAASANCDEGSLKDIKEISRSIPHYTSKSLAPILIDNAQTDQVTKGYKSIVSHNILSVMCVPVQLNHEVVGALYLDHHTLPGLFNKKDLAYIQTMSRFFGSALATISQFKNLDTINNQLSSDLKLADGKSAFITKDENITSMLDKIPEIAKTNAPVLILGDSGTGKEILCQRIHKLSLRDKAPLIKLNCAAITSSMIESELFGVAKNVATGVDAREGKFSAADGGTLFLDEIGDLSLETQAKVLRAVENQEFEKVGSTRPVCTDIRFIYATNKNLKELIKSGKFREDLYYRINTITIEIPALHKRRCDILPLIDYFLENGSAKKNRPIFSYAFKEALVAYRWPGNVREVKNLVERYCILYPGKHVDISLLPDEIKNDRVKNYSTKEASRALEIAHIKEALIASNWNYSQAAISLQIPLTTLRRKSKINGLRKP